MLLIVLIGVKVSKLDQVPIGTGQRTEKKIRHREQISRRHFDFLRRRLETFTTL